MIKCPNCGEILDNGKICGKCGADAILLEKAVKLSNKLYNDGLRMAKCKDMSGAMSCLSKSILINKRNINARNLLGLLYFETGRIGDALKQWVISTNIKEDANAAREYIEDYRKNEKEYKKLNEALKMYNQAVKFMQQKSDDMAVIQLRKAVDINSKFVDALNMLALCYILQNKDSKADEIIKNVLNIDVKNAAALRYYRHLHPDKGTHFEETPIKKISDREPTLKYNSNVVKGGVKSKVIELAMFIIGCVCTAVIMYILVIPGISEAKDEEMKTVQNEFEEMKKDYDEQSNVNADKIKKLEEENANLKVQNEQYTKQANEQAMSDKISNANSLFSEGKVEDAISIIGGIDTALLSEENKNAYNEIKDKAYSSRAKTMYNEGKKLYDRKKYDEAKTALSEGVVYGDGNLQAKYSSMYYLGKIYMEEGDSEKAKEYFSQVKDNHPDKSMRGYASGWLNGL